MTEHSLIKQFQSVEDAFNDALTSNNVDEISKFLSGDWILLEPQFGIIDKDRFLHVIKFGQLCHKSMRKTVLRVKIHNDIALVTTRGMNTGSHQNNLFDSEQWVTNIYKKENGSWICIMTQEAPVSCS